MESTLLQKLHGDLKAALRQGDKVKLGTLRLIVSAVQYAEIAEQKKLYDAGTATSAVQEKRLSDADVQARIDEIRDRKAEYVNEDPRPLADGDYAVVSLESLSGVDEKIQQDELTLKLGDEATMAAFTENLRGVSPDESREFEVTYPADYDRENLAGRTVRFQATVKAVRRKELPEPNDDFAKDMGDYQTGAILHQGLTEFGAEVIRACHRLGLVCDVAHATEDMVMQAVKVASKPLLLSHTAVSGSPAMGPTPLRGRQVSDRLPEGLLHRG
jgi:hypothetical protein